MVINEFWKEIAKYIEVNGASKIPEKRFQVIQMNICTFPISFWKFWNSLIVLHSFRRIAYRLEPASSQKTVNTLPICDNSTNLIFLFSHGEKAYVQHSCSYIL